MIGIGIGIPFNRYASGVSIDAQAQAHYDRVTAPAEGGVIPKGLAGCSAYFTAIKAIYGVSDINSAVAAAYDPDYLGYKLGAGSGTTAGQAAQKLYSPDPTGAADVVQTTAASQPLLLAHSGTNYWWGSNASDNYCSTPNAAANQITGDIDFKIKLDYTNNSGAQYILSKYQAVLTNHAYTLFIDGSNVINYYFTVAGSFYGYSSTAGIGASYSNWVRVTRSSSTGVITFYTSTDGTNWVQLGSTVAGVSGAVDNSNANLLIGSYGNGNGVSLLKIYRATISNSIGGAPVVVYNPQSYNPSVSQTSWVSATDETWTVNVGTASSGYKGCLVSRTLVQGDGVDDVMNSTLSGSGRFTQYLSASPYGSITGNEAIAGPWNGSSWRGAIYTNGSKFATYQGSGSDGVFGSTITKGQLVQVGVVNSSTGTDWQPFVNGVDVSNSGLNIGSQNSYTSINLLARSGGITYSNSRINTYLLSSSADTATIRTAMYNIIRQLNNSAF